MTAAAPHRGRRSSWCGAEAWLAGLRREGASSTGPWSDPAGELVLVADARIDNREELAALLGLGRGERPVDDGQLILAAYHRWGADCAPRLIGDFAFAIWDERRRRLFAARDPMGMRAFYYRREPGRTLFATEVKQILAAPGVPVRLFEPAVAAHLAGPYGRPEWTFYEGIDQLAPGNALHVEESHHTVRRFWNLDPHERIRYRDEAQYVEHFRELFAEAVRCRLRGETPVGLLLSGGLDSGSIAAMASWLRENGEPVAPLHAYCFAYDDLPECDERAVSRLVVEHHGLTATDVATNDAWPLAGYPVHGPDRDDPFVGVYQPMLDRSLEMARRDGARRLISGDRGDLTMGEYIYDLVTPLRRGHWIRAARELRTLMEIRGWSAARALHSQVWRPIQRGLWPSYRLPRLRRALRPVYHRLRRRSDPLPSWLRSDLVERTGLPELMAEPGDEFRSGYHRCRRHQAIFDPHRMRAMVWSDRSWARHGLEFADPWSDVRLARFAVSVPQRVLNRPGEDKRLVRRALHGIMADEALRRTAKISPMPAYYDAVRRRARPLILHLLDHSEAARRGFIDQAAIQNHYRHFCDGGPEDWRLWSALEIEMWLRLHWTVAGSATAERSWARTTAAR